MAQHPGQLFTGAARVAQGQKRQKEQAKGNVRQFARQVFVRIKRSQLDGFDGENHVGRAAIFANRCRRESIGARNGPVSADRELHVAWIRSADWSEVQRVLARIAVNPIDCRRAGDLDAEVQRSDSDSCRT